MCSTDPEIRGLARWLLAREADAGDSPASDDLVAVRVCNRFKRFLSALMGINGYTVLLSRALALAKAEAPWLDAVQVDRDGALEGWGAVKLPEGIEDPTRGGEALVSQLLCLLTTFIGHRLTLRLVRDEWPDAPFDVTDAKSETEA